MPLPLFAGIAAAYAARTAFNIFKHPIARNKLLGAFGWGFSYAAGTNVGYNIFNEYLTPHLRTNEIMKYTGTPRYVNRL